MCVLGCRVFSCVFGRFGLVAAGSVLAFVSVVVVFDRFIVTVPGLCVFWTSFAFSSTFVVYSELEL